MIANNRSHILYIRTPGSCATTSPPDTVAQGIAAQGIAAKAIKEEYAGSGSAQCRLPSGRSPRENHRWIGQGEASAVARGFTAFANSVAHFTGRPITFVLCCLAIAGWAVTGPIFSYSDTWQLIINTGTTIITFLMVFLIQNTQNRDGAAVQAKLDELIRAVEGARNHFIGIEHLTEEQLEAIRSLCEKDALREEAALAAEFKLIEKAPEEN